MTNHEQKNSRPLAFECLRCSQCCTGEGAAWLLCEELPAAAALLDLAPEAFVELYCRRRGEKYEIICDENGVCILLGPDGCRIHQAKPRICRAWPWLGAMLKNASAFEEAKLVCPGINPQASHAEFLAQYEAEKQKEK